jgi:hypothetical protein
MADPITTLAATDKLSDSRADINANFVARHDWADAAAATDYSMLADDEAIYVDASAGIVKVTLLPTADARANQRVLIYAEDGTNVITIEVDDVATETIGVGASTSMTLTASEHFVELIRKGTGTAWYPLARRN